MSFEEDGRQSRRRWNTNLKLYLFLCWALSAACAKLYGRHGLRKELLVDGSGDRGPALDLTGFGLGHGLDDKVVPRRAVVGELVVVLHHGRHERPIRTLLGRTPVFTDLTKKEVKSEN